VRDRLHPYHCPLQHQRSKPCDALLSHIDHHDRNFPKAPNHLWNCKHRSCCSGHHRCICQGSSVPGRQDPQVQRRSPSMKNRWRVAKMWTPRNEEKGTCNKPCQELTLESKSRTHSTLTKRAKVYQRRRSLKAHSAGRRRSRYRDCK
jgi:hypothetical protein